MSDARTDWQEEAAPGEAQAFDELAREFAALQARMDQRHGRGRALHRKQIVGAHGTLAVLDGLPAWAAQGLFAQPGTFAATLRLSNGGAATASDRKPDVRGFALRVDGLEGWQAPSALGGTAKAQVFSAIHLEAFGFANGIDFGRFVLAAVQGPGPMFAWALRRHGLFGGPRFMAGMLKGFKRPFDSFATARFHSTVPVANGPYAVRYRFVPALGNGAPGPAGCSDYGAEFAERLRTGALAWEMQLQPFTREAETPIEDATLAWPTPFVTVAHLSLPEQVLDSDDGRALQQACEQGVFDPWVALAAHRPLGGVQRARKAVYFASEQHRGAV